MTKNIKFQFETNNWFLAYGISFIFLPFYYEADINIFFKILIYFVPPFILSKFVDNNRMEIYEDSISYYKYAKRFEKRFEINFLDIEKVIVTRPITYRFSPTLTVFQKSKNKKFMVQIHRGIDEKLCEFFLDNKIKVDTNNSELRNHMWHYSLGHKAKN